MKSPIRFAIDLPPVSAGDIATWSAKANSRVRFADATYFPVLAVAFFLAWANFPWMFDWFVSHSLITSNALLSVAFAKIWAVVLSMVLVISPAIVIGKWSSPWRDLQYRLSPIRILDASQAVRWAREYPEIDSYRRAVASLPREFTIGDFEAMSLFVKRKEAAASMIRDMDKRHAVMSDLHSLDAQGQ